MRKQTKEAQDKIVYSYIASHLKPLTWAFMAYLPFNSSFRASQTIFYSSPKEESNMSTCVKRNMYAMENKLHTIIIHACVAPIVIIYSLI